MTPKPNTPIVLFILYTPFLYRTKSRPYESGQLLTNTSYKQPIFCTSSSEDAKTECFKCSFHFVYDTAYAIQMPSVRTQTAFESLLLIQGSFLKDWALALFNSSQRKNVDFATTSIDCVII